MKTTFKEQLANTIIAACSEVTDDCRRKLTDVKELRNPNITDEVIDKVKLVYNGNAKIALLTLFAQGFQDSRFLVSEETNHLEPLAVIVAELGFEKQYFICTSAKYKTILDKDGLGDIVSTLSKVSLSSFATTKQIVQCVAQLTDAQWRFVMQSDLFAPLVKQTMEDEITIQVTQ